MATQEVLNGLTDVIQTCLEDKLQSGFDANAELSITVMREIATALETKINNYTDVEINTVKTLIENGEIDLGPFNDFMMLMKTMLDGDEDNEGYQVFEQLIVDTTNIKTGIITVNSTITQIQNTIQTLQTTINDHATRIAELEAAQHEPMDCETCQDEIIGLIDSSFEDGCSGASGVLQGLTTQSFDILQEFRNSTLGSKISSKMFDVLVGDFDSTITTDAVTLDTDFRVSIEFAFTSPYEQSAMMLFGGDYRNDLYCRVDPSDRSIRVWMNSVDDLDYVSFVPSEVNVFDGCMHTVTLERIGDKMYVTVDNENLGSQPAYMYAGVNNLVIGGHNAIGVAAGLPAEMILGNFTVTSLPTGGPAVTLINKDENVGITRGSAVERQTFVYADNGPDTLYLSTSADLNFRKYVSQVNETKNIVIIGASIMEQSHYSMSDASRRFVKKGVIAEVFNRATSGDRSGDLLAKLPTYLEEFKGKEENTIFVLHIGGNNISQDGPYPGGAVELGNDYRAIVTNVLDAGYKIVPSSLTYRIPPSSNPSNDYNVNVIYPLIQELTPEWFVDGKPVLDFYTETFNNQGTWLETDGIHPNGFGEASIREYIANVITSRLVSEDWEGVIPADTGNPRNVVINFGEDNFMLGKWNNVPENGEYFGGEFRNTDYSLCSNLGVKLNGAGPTPAEGRIKGSLELSVRNRDVVRSGVWIDAAATGLITFKAGSFIGSAKYTVRIASSRVVAELRTTEFVVGGQTKVVNSTSTSPEFITFEGISGEDLMTSGISVGPTVGVQYGYVSGIQIVLEKDGGGLEYQG